MTAMQPQPPPRNKLPFALGAALAVGALCWSGTMRHPTYFRQVLLTALMAPGALALALAAIGPDLASLRSAVRPWPVRLFLGAAWAHALLAWASMCWSSHPDATLDRAITLTTLAVWASAWVLAAACDWQRMALSHLSVLGLVAFVGASTHALRMIAGDAPARLEAPIGNPNTVAVLMFFAALPGVALATAGRGWQRWLGTAACLMGATAFVFARSRSGLVGILAAGTILAASAVMGLLRRRRASGWWLWGPAAALAVTSAAAFSFALRDDAVTTCLWEKVRTGSLGARYYGTVAGLGILAEHPLGGAGAGTFVAEAAKHIPVERGMVGYASSFLNVAHNEYAETLAELGISGLVCLLGVLGAAVWGAWRRATAPGPDDGSSRALSAGLCAAVAGVAVSSLADPSFRYWDFTGIFYAGAALAASACRGQPGAVPATAAAAGLRPRRMLVALGFVVVSGATWVFWSMPDAYRECKWQEARCCWRLADDRARAFAEAESGPACTEAAGQTLAAHGRACAAYRAAALTPGYYLSRVQAHYDWVIERIEYAMHVRTIRERAGGLTGKATDELVEAESQGLAEAEALAVQLEAAMPENPLVLFLLANAKQQRGDRCGALVCMIRAGRRDPFSAARLTAWAAIFGRGGVANDGLCREAADRAGAGDEGAAVLRSLARAVAGDWTGAEAELRGILTEDVDFVALDLCRGRILREAGRPAEAQLALGRHLDRWPIHAEGWRELARAIRAQGGPDAAGREIAALRRCVSLDVEHEDGKLRLARLLADTGRRAEAVSLLRGHLPIARRRADFVLLLTRLCEEDGRTDEARRVLEEGLRRSRSSALKDELNRLNGGQPETGPP